LIGAIVQGAFGGGLNIEMVLLGAVIAIVLIVLKMPVMSVAIGIYLPLALSVPIMLGGIISYFALNSAYIRIDGSIKSNPSPAAKKAAKEVENRGVLIGAGFIAGESLLGVFIALLIVSDIKLNEIFSVTTLGDLFSLMFFGWFVAVFIWLATRALPKGGNLVTESQIIVLDACQKLFNAFKLKNLK
jgi:hypothetical protein